MKKPNQGWGQLLNLARVKLEERMRETGREQARNTLLVPVTKARGLAVKHSAQGRHANRLPGVRLFCEVLIK